MGGVPDALVASFLTLCCRSDRHVWDIRTCLNNKGAHLRPGGLRPAPKGRGAPLAYPAVLFAEESRRL